MSSTVKTKLAENNAASTTFRPRTNVAASNVQDAIEAVADAVSAEDLDFAGDTGTGAVDLDTQTLNVVTTNNSLTTTASGNTLTISLSNVLEDLDTLGPPNNNNEFLVSTGAGVLNWERNAAVRTSMDVYSTAEVDAAIAAAVTAEDLDFAGDTGTGAVDLDSQTLTIAGGDGITTSAASQTATIDVDATVARYSTLASTSNGQGASLIGIEDSGSRLTATNVEAALAEIAVGTTWVNAKVRGLDFTDSNTNAAANLSLMNTIISENVAIWFDEGDPWFSGRLDFSDRLIHVKGMGKGHTRLHFDDPASATAADNCGIYAVNSNGDLGQPYLDGFTVYAEYDSNAKDGTGIYLEQTVASGTEDGLQVKNVHVRGVTGGANQNCWNVGYRILGYGGSLFLSASCALKRNLSEAGFIFDDSSTGQASINPNLYQCTIFSSVYGAKFLGDNEGGRFVGCNIQEVNWGAYKDHGASPAGSQPFLSFINTHINSYLGGVDIVNGRYVIIDGCLWYAKVDADATTYGISRSNYYFVRSIGPNDGPTPSSRLNFGHLITNSKFKANSVLSGGGDIYGVYADYTDRSIVSNMTFESCTKPIYLGANTNDWYIPHTNTAYVHPQDTTGAGAGYTEPTDFITDLGTNNICHHDGFQFSEFKLRDNDRSHFVGLRSPSSVTTSHYLTLGGQNASRTLSFGGNVTTGGDLTTNGAVTVSTFAATLLDDTTEVQARGTVNASRGGWVRLASAAASGASVVFSSISQDYRELAVYFSEVSHDDAGNQHFRVEISLDNGGSYNATPVVVSANVAAATQVKGMVCTISNYSVSADTKIAMAHGSFNQSTGVGYLEDSTAETIDAIRITASGGNLDNGTIYLMAR